MNNKLYWQKPIGEQKDPSVILKTNYGHDNWKYYEIRQVAKASYSLTYCEDIVWHCARRHVLKDDFPKFSTTDNAKKAAQKHWSKI